jgi:hypothetical protein
MTTRTATAGPPGLRRSCGRSNSARMGLMPQPGLDGDGSTGRRAGTTPSDHGASNSLIPTTEDRACCVSIAHARRAGPTRRIRSAPVNCPTCWTGCAGCPTHAVRGAGTTRCRTSCPWPPAGSWLERSHAPTPAEPSPNSPAGSAPTQLKSPPW